MIEFKTKTVGKLIFTSVFFVIVFSCCWLVFFLIKGSVEETSLKQNKIDQVEVDGKEMVSLGKIVNETKEERLILNSSFVASDEVAFFAEKLESLASLAGAKLVIDTISDQPKNNVTEEDEEKKDKLVFLDKLSVSFSAKGTFRSVMKTLSLIEYMPYRISIIQARVEKENTVKKDKVAVPEWILSANIEVFKLNQNVKN